MIPPLAGWPEGDDSRTVLIGLTGPIGCGKSTVAGFLREMGGVVIDADELAREATSAGAATLAAHPAALWRRSLCQRRRARSRGPGQDRLQRRTGAGRSGARSSIRPYALWSTNASQARLSERVPFVVVEAIKLVEGGLAERCDEVWIVECDRCDAACPAARPWLHRRRHRPAPGYAGQRPGRPSCRTARGQDPRPSPEH